MDALWEATAFPGVKPDLPMMDRLSNILYVDEFVEVEEALNMNVLSNPQRTLSEAEIDLTREMADKGKVLKFCGNSEPEQLEIARTATGTLPKAIIDHFDAKIAQKDQKIKSPLGKKKFVFFSAHDYTMLPFLSFLGFNNMEIPRFASMIVIELHKVPHSAHHSPNPKKKHEKTEKPEKKEKGQKSETGEKKKEKKHEKQHKEKKSEEKKVKKADRIEGNSDKATEKKKKNG